VNRASKAEEHTVSARGWGDVLAEVPLFAGLNRRQLKRVAGAALVRRFHDKTAIVRAGGPADTLYVVLDGSVSVRRRGLPNITLGMGSVFGEMALLDNGPRSATVIADGPVTCLAMTQARFLKIVRAEPAIALALLKELAARLRAVQTTAL
jgi:CRP/FNR family transcriptional regulator, cyclic AMP receptor protein